MKVLIIIGSFKTGGAERMSINTGEELIKRGYDVYYIVQKPIFEIPNSIPKERIFVLRKKDKVNIVYKLSALFFGVYSVASKIKPDAVIAFSRFSSFLACFTFNKNIIARFDANPFILRRKQRIWANYVIKSQLVKKIIVPSYGMLLELQQLKPQFSEKFYVIPNSINLQNIKVENIKSNIYNFKYISAMGRLSHDKNFELLIESFAESSINKMFKLIIVGDGKFKLSLQEQVKKLGLNEKIIFTGRLENPFPVIYNSVFFVNTSLKESFCNVILEALALSKPVLATNCNYGPSDMIVNGVNGFLIKNNDKDELVSKLNELAVNEKLLQCFAGNARDSIKKFDIQNIGDMWENLLKEILGEDKSITCN